MVKIALIENNSFKPRLIPAAFVYVLMALSLEYFIFTSGLGVNIQTVLLNAGLIGLVTFGTYDFTNRAILKDYPLILSLVDTSWGVFIFSTTGLLSFIIRGMF